MKYRVIPTTKFNKDLKRMQRRGYDLEKIKEVIKLLSLGNPLPINYHDHQLTGNYAGKRECHVLPDWLMVYEIDGNNLILLLLRTGTHSDLF